MALMLASAQMMTHMGMEAQARRLRDAIREALREGDTERLTPDVGGHGTTDSLAGAVIDHLD